MKRPAKWRAGAMDAGKVSTRYGFTYRDTFTREEAEVFAAAYAEENAEELSGIAPLTGGGEDEEPIAGPLVAVYVAGVRFTPDARPFARCSRCGATSESETLIRRDGALFCEPCDREALGIERCAATSGGLTCSRVRLHQGEHVFDDVPAPPVKS